MSLHDSFNPNDNNMGHGETYAVVLDVKDPKKSGRVLVRILGHQEGFKSKDECQWVNVNIPGGARKSGSVGTSPQSADMVPTDVVKLNYIGQQTVEIVGHVGKSDDSEKSGDISPYSQEKEIKFTSPTHNSNPGNPGYTWTSDLYDTVQKDADAIWEQFKKWQNGKLPINHKNGDWVKTALQGQAPSDFLHRMFNRNTGKSIGLEQFKGELTDATKFLQQVGQAAVIPSAFDMLSKLKSTAGSGANINNALAVGGLSNITSAISGAAAHLASINKQNTENAEDPYEAYLRQLYREETGLEPLNDDGSETTLYTVWKAAYLAAEALIESGVTS